MHRKYGENKVKVAKLAAENGTTKAMRHFKETKEFTDSKEPTIRGWVKKLKEIMVVHPVNIQIS